MYLGHQSQQNPAQHKQAAANPAQMQAQHPWHGQPELEQEHRLGQKRQLEQERRPEKEHRSQEAYAGKQYRLLSLDMDGTVLNSQKHVSPGNARAISDLVKRGGNVTLCTGRNLLELHKFAGNLAPVQFAVLMNGSVTYDFMHNRPIQLSSIPRDLALRAAQTALGVGAIVHVMTLRATYIRQQDIDRLADYNLASYHQTFDTLATRIDDPCAFIADHAAEITKLNLYHLTQEDRARTKHALADTGLTLSYSEAASLEVTPAGCSKATGVKRLCDELGMGMDQVVAVGDGLNDLAVLQAVGMPVAMANAAPEVKAIARAKVTDNDHDGVAEAIQRFFPVR